MVPQFHGSIVKIAQEFFFPKLSYNFDSFHNPKLKTEAIITPATFIHMGTSELKTLISKCVISRTK